MDNALIIFVRKPQLGKVKTRLAAQIGNKKALHIYKKLLTHTQLVATEANCDKYVFATDKLSSDDWIGFYHEDQFEGDLGERMSHAFNVLFAKGYAQVVIIGSDCPGLTCPHIDEAFKSLQEYDVVIGPAQDGGYYLLGMKKTHVNLFQNKNWSTNTVYGATIDSIKKEQLSLIELEMLSDLDKEKDIPGEWRKELDFLPDLTESK